MAQRCLFMSPPQDWELPDGRECILYMDLHDPCDQDWHGQRTGDELMFE